ncbi:MAG TPA: TonB family protein [Terriglobales bacterium]|nr:TonB family protein [Terriglobales bacterium]
MAGTWNQWEGHVVDGRFKLVQYLGGSDRSAVFLTERGDQKAAIKLVNADPQTVEQQLSRWETATKLLHPHLIALFERGCCQLGDARMLYLVMEYADENLSQVLPQRPLTPRETWEMLPGILEALSYLHARRFAHAGLKPGNIMAVADELKLASDDVRAFSDGRRDTENGTVTNPRTRDAYDPPEAGISSATDVWSLGMTLVEVLTQRRPEGESLNRQPPILPEAIPQPFLEIVLHCLAREPERRWTVAEIAGQLQGAASAPPAATGQEEPRERTTTAPPATPTSRYWIPVVVAGMIVAAILAAPRLEKGKSKVENASESVAEQPAATPAAPAATHYPASSQPNGARRAPATPPASSGIANETPGAVLEKVLPNVPKSARDTIEGHIRVRVKVDVDSSGHVTTATLASPGPSPYFAKQALQASLRWKFTPPQANGQQPVASEWMLRYQFGNRSTEVSPVQISP